MNRRTVVHLPKSNIWDVSVMESVFLQKFKLVQGKKYITYVVEAAVIDLNNTEHPPGEIGGLAFKRDAYTLYT